MKSKYKIIFALSLWGILLFLALNYEDRDIKSEHRRWRIQAALKSDLHRLYLSCQVFWKEFGLKEPCSKKLVDHHKIDFISSNISAQGDFHTFSAFAYSDRVQKKTYKIDHKGNISESTLGIMRNEEAKMTSARSSLIKFHQACRAYWQATSSLHECSIKNAVDHRYIMPEDFTVIGQGAEPSFSATAFHPKGFEMATILADQVIKETFDDVTRSHLFGVNLACKLFWKKNGGDQNCSLKQAEKFGFHPKPGVQVTASSYGSTGFPRLNAVALFPGSLLSGKAHPSNRQKPYAFRLRGYNHFSRKKYYKINLVTLWDMQSGQIAGYLPAYDLTNILTFSPDGKTLAVANRFFIQLWDVSSLKELPSLNIGVNDSPNALIYSPKGTHLIAGGDSGYIYIWEVKKGEKVSGILKKRIDLIPGSYSDIGGLVFNPDGTSFLALVDNETIFCLEFPSGRILWEMAVGLVYKPLLPMSLNGNLLALGNRKEVKVLDMSTREVIFHFQISKNKTDIRSFAFSKNGESFFVGLLGTLRRWNTTTWQELPSIGQGRQSPINISSDDNAIYTLGTFRRINRYDIKTGELSHLNPGFNVTTGIGYGSFSKNHKFMASP